MYKPSTCVRTARPTIVFSCIAGNYVYDIFVRACSVSTYSSVQAYFCSHAACDGTIGEEVQVLLEMNHGDDRWTWTPFSSTFNPVAMRLELADEDW